MKKKRKGSETDAFENLGDELTPNREAKSSILASHFSLEDYIRLSKRCKEDVGNETIGSCKNRLAGIATAPPCGAALSLVPPGRGLKRKIGCIDAATQTGRKKKIEEDYVTGPKIGRGKFGSVWLCRSKATGVEFACKTLHKGEETVHREVEIMQHLSGHPGVVTLHAVYEELECFHLVMELCSGGRLIDKMVEEGPYSEQHAANIFKDVMFVVKYCHDMGVVHRDIKPENILLMSSGKIKVADFGMAMRISNGQTLSGLAGSPAYVAPEVLLGNYSEKVDIWSAGVLLHMLLVGVLPFKGDSLEDVFEAIKNAKLDFHTGIWETVSKPARDLLARMLTRDVSARITADEVLIAAGLVAMHASVICEVCLYHMCVNYTVFLHHCSHALLVSHPDFRGHPWILFYTERTLKTLSIKSKLKTQVTTSSQRALASVSESYCCKLRVGSLAEEFNLQSLSDGLGCKSNDQDECDSVDALAVAVSHVKISEPKRSRLCGPTGQIEQQCSSNLTANNLCKAC